MFSLLNTFLKNIQFNRNCNTIKWFFRLNASHIFIGGGYIPIYDVNGLQVLNSGVEFAGNETLNKAWLFDGFVWKEIEPMNDKRQNFACTLAFNQDLNEVF